MHATMPISTSSRNSTAFTASITTATPSRSKFPRAMSPPSAGSYSPTITSAGQAVKLNIVTRIAIEGKAKQGQEGASVRMYMKLSVPVDSATPGSTVALFPEENIKILTSQVHPLNSNLVPYNFSSTVSPLLHNAARALNLPARSSTTFDMAFHLGSTPYAVSSTASTSRSREPEGSPAIPPVDPQYTGHIQVSGYHIAYVLPKYFFGRENTRLPSEGETERSNYSLQHKRRPSISERSHVHFMAAVDMWIPYITRPPRFPYLLSIPTPRCLYNNIKLRIFPPSNTTSSFASLSSLEDDANTWDLTSDPHVTRVASARLSRSSSYNNFADDESSDSSSAGFPDGIGVQGTFPSADRIRVRWAKPMKSFDRPEAVGDTRRRVGVKDVQSEMTCTIKGKRRNAEGGLDGIIMDVDYKATCKGIWFPGVATLLGMDVGLVAKNSDVTWVEGSPPEWKVAGELGYTGFNVTGTEQPDLNPLSRTSSMDSRSPQTPLSASAEKPQALQPNGRTRYNSSSSTSSLLRAPLPSQGVPEYSFESSNDPTASVSSNLGTLSSVSLSQSSAPLPPGNPLTLHLNMNDILPPKKTPFAFSVAGTILVTPRPSLPRPNGTHETSFVDYAETTEPITLPKFTVLAADAETTNIVVRNEIDRIHATVEVYNPSGDINRDPQTRKTVLQKGGYTRCGEDGGRIAIKIIGGSHETKLPARPTTPSDVSKVRIPSRSLHTTRQIRSDPLIIPSVIATVTPLLPRHHPLPDAYAVRVHLNAPVNAETDWLEFGLVRAGPSLSRTPLHEGGETYSPNVHIAAASVGGVLVRCEITNTGRQRANGEARHGISFEMVDSKEWTYWVKVHIGPSCGDIVIIDYIVKVETVKSSWLSSWKKQRQLDMLLPTFALAVGRFEVKLEALTGFTCTPTHSSFTHQHWKNGNYRLLQFTQEEFFSPELVLVLRPVKSTTPSGLFWIILALLCCLVLASSVLLQRLGQDFQQVQRYLQGNEFHFNSTVAECLDPVTVTATLISTVTADASRWFPGLSSIHQPSPTQQDSIRTMSYTPTVSSVLSQPQNPGSTPSPAVTLASQDSLSTHILLVWEKIDLSPIQELLDSVSLLDFGFIDASRRLVRNEWLEKVWSVFSNIYYVIL